MRQENVTSHLRSIQAAGRAVRPDHRPRKMTIFLDGFYVYPQDITMFETQCPNCQRKRRSDDLDPLWCQNCGTIYKGNTAVAPLSVSIVNEVAQKLAGPEPNIPYLIERLNLVLPTGSDSDA